MARRVVDALTFWGIVTLAVLSCSVGLASDACACSKSKAYVAAMKSDLRNMVSAQEAYFAEHGRYGSDSVLQAGGMTDLFRSSTGVTMAIEYADAQRWRARATHVAIPAVCTIESSTAVAGSSEYEDLGTPRCDGNTRRRNCHLNVPLNLSVDLWLFAFTVRRRQNRRREDEALSASHWNESPLARVEHACECEGPEDSTEAMRHADAVPVRPRASHSH